MRLSIKSVTFKDETPKLVAAAVRGQTAFLRRFGAFTRTRAKGLIRKRKRPADPGQPPSDHGGPLDALILFAVDKARKSVVIGPLAVGGRRTAPAEAPKALEQGGAVSIRLRPRPQQGGKRTKVNQVRPHPFMRPAFDRTMLGVPDLLRGSILREG